MTHPENDQTTVFNHSKLPPIIVKPETAILIITTQYKLQMIFFFCVKKPNKNIEK